MISVEQARELVVKNITSLSVEVQKIEDSNFHYLAEDILSPVDVPMFNQSAMDGYAFKYADKDIQLTVVDEVAAGETKKVAIKPGEAVRIFTGSKVPDSCDVVVMQELTERTNHIVIVKDAGLKPSGNIRKQGFQLAKNDVAFKKGEFISPATIGFLATLGIEKVKVHKVPTVAVIATGSELKQLGTTLIDGQIFESNTYMLNSALQYMGVVPQIIVVTDNQSIIENKIKEVIANFDAIIITGGISVGDYDFVKECLENNQVKEVFHKIKQKPGKPMYFGKKEQKIIFALPGNPAAALSCFYMYVFPAIRTMMGSKTPFLPVVKMPLSEKYIKKEGRAVFLKSVISNNKVEILKGQESDALQSFARAHVIVYIPSEKQEVEQNELVDVHLLPQFI